LFAFFAVLLSTKMNKNGNFCKKRVDFVLVLLKSKRQTCEKDLPFLFFMDFTIYAISIDCFRMRILVRKHKFGKASNLILDHMISQLSPELR
jgi:hypothetical protein